MQYIPQLGQFDCGFACLKMMLAHLYKDSNYLYLPFKEQNKPFSYQQLIDIALKHHLELTGFKVEDETEIRNNKVFPLMVSLSKDHDVKHAVLITSIRGNRLQISDPDQGTYSMSLKKFYLLWDKTGLLVKNYANTPCPFIHEETVKPKDHIVPFICQFLTGAFGVLSVYFFDKDIPLFIPLLLLLGMVVFEILLRFVLFKGMRKVDGEILDKINLKPKEYNIFHQRFENFKQVVMTTPLNFIYVFMVCAFLIFIILLNDPRNIFLIIVPLMLAFLDSFYLKPYLKKNEEVVARSEKSLMKSDNVEQFKQGEYELHEKTYQYGKLILIKKYTFIALMLIATCALMIANQQFSIPYIVFYLCIEFALYTNLNTLFSFSIQKRKYLQTKVALNNIIHQNDEII